MTNFLNKQDIQRYVVYPIEHQDIWMMYKKHMASFWTVEEIDFSHDKQDWKKLNKDEQFFIKNILAFFAVSDGVVLENVMSRFMSEITLPEARSFYGFQIAMENVHAETYSLLVDTYIEDKIEKEQMFTNIMEYSCVREKTEWALKWMKSDRSFTERLIAFAVVEGIFFSGSFCAIFWLKKRNLLHGLSFSNELIARDEGLHCDFACLLYSKLEPLNTSVIHDIVKEAVEIEISFITQVLPCALIGMNALLMKEYIKFCADRLLEALNTDKIYFASNPFEWMQLISLQGKTNFFEKKVSEYQKSNVMHMVDKERELRTENFVFSTNEEF